MGKPDKAQSSMEYLVTYGWAILIIAIVVSLLYLYVIVPSTVVPSTCSFVSGAYCNNIIVGTNLQTHVTKLAGVAAEAAAHTELSCLVIHRLQIPDLCQQGQVRQPQAVQGASLVTVLLTDQPVTAAPAHLEAKAVMAAEAAVVAQQAVAA